MKKVWKALANLDTLIAGVTLCGIVFMTVAGVIMRKAVGKPFAWLEEMQLFFFVWSVFFGGSVAFRHGGQISIDLIANRLRPGARRVLDILDYAVTMAVLAYLAVGGFQLVESVTRKVTPYFKISYTFIDVAAPVGLILMMAQYTWLIIRELRGAEEPQITEEGGEA